MKKIIAVVLFFCVTLLMAQVPPRPLPKNQVNDLAEVLDDSARTAALEYKLRKITDSSHVEIVAVTVRRIENLSSLEFTQQLAKAWEDENEKRIAIFVLIDVEDRDFAIVPGTEYASKMDAFICRKIEDQYLKPYFRDNEYYEGFNQASTAIVNHITGKLTDTQLKSDDQYHLYILGSLAVLIVLLVSFYYLLKGIQANSFGSRPMGFSSAFLLLSHIHPVESDFKNFEKGTGKFKTDVSGSNLVNFGGGSWGSW